MRQSDTAALSDGTDLEKSTTTISNFRLCFENASVREHALPVAELDGLRLRNGNRNIATEAAKLEAQVVFLSLFLRRAKHVS